MPNRFDYVAYDPAAAKKQGRLKACAQRVEAALLELEASTSDLDTAIKEELGVDEVEFNNVDRARDALNEVCPEKAMESLEVAYMWCGKAIRDDQIVRNGSAPLQEGRNNG